MGKLYVPQNRGDLIRLAEGYASPDEQTPSLEPRAEGLQAYIRIVSLVDDKSRVRHSVCPARPVLPGPFQTEAYVSGIISRYNPEASDELKMQSTGIRMGIGALLKKSGAEAEYLFPMEALQPSEYIGRQAVKETLEQMRDGLHTGKSTARILPEGAAPDADGINLVYLSSQQVALSGTRVNALGFVDQVESPLHPVPFDQIPRLEEQFFNLSNMALSTEVSLHMIDQAVENLAN